MHLNNRFYMIKNTIVAVFLAAALLYAVYPTNPNLQVDEKSANFSQNDIADIRGIFTKACIIWTYNYGELANYVRTEMKYNFGSYWNVVIYNKADYNAKFYITGTYDSTHLNKRYYQVDNSQPYGFSMLVLETNNTVYEQNEPKMVDATQELKKEIAQGPLQYTKTKSQFVSSSQEAGIDLAITTAYTWNKNIVDFSKVLQKLTETNLNEHWEVVTSIENLGGFAFRYTSPYDQWIEYSGYGLGATHWHVYIWRNVITG